MSELTTLHEAIRDTLVERMPKVMHVESFPDLQGDVQLPAVLFALTDMTQGQDRGEGKTGLVGLFQAAILVDPCRDHAPLQAAILATQVARVLDDQYWGQDFIVGPPEDVRAYPDGSAPELAQFVVWVVEWTQPFEVGELEWPWPDEGPGSLVFSFDPQTGSGNEGEYFPPEALA